LSLKLIDGPNSCTLRESPAQEIDLGVEGRDDQHIFERHPPHGSVILSQRLRQQRLNDLGHSLGLFGAALGASCVFRRSGPPIPNEGGHRFRLMAARDSDDPGHGSPSLAM